MEDEDGEDLDVRAHVRTGSSAPAANESALSRVKESSVSSDTVSASSSSPSSSLQSTPTTLLSTLGSDSSSASNHLQPIVNSDLPKGQFSNSAQQTLYHERYFEIL